MRRRVQFALLAAAVANATLAGAADKPDQALRIRKISSQYVTCLIFQSIVQVRRFVIEGMRPPVAGACLTKVTHEVGVEMTFPGDSYRYALAEGLLLHDFPTGMPTGVKDAPLVTSKEPDPLDETKLPKNPKKAAALREAHAKRRMIWMTGLLGDCTARLDPAAAFALMKSDVGSSEERAGFDALKSSIGECLPENATIRLAPGVLRGAIAVSLYRLANSLRTTTHA